MDTPELKKIWKEKYKVVASQLEKIKNIKAAATAFNTNIDAVIKISASRLKELISEQGLSLAELEDIKETKIKTTQDVVKGIFKCFKNGIAEEWITEEKSVYDWMNNTIGYDRLQIGGQGGIVANALATVGIQKVYAHTNSLPKLQAEQFVKKDNLFSFNEKGEPIPAYLADRTEDIALIHWIIEFDKNDILEIEGQKFKCPKSNRFIATYDPLNLKLITDKHFMSYMHKNPVEYVVLSGFHALTSNNNGEALIEGILPDLKKWKEVIIFYIGITILMTIVEFSGGMLIETIFHRTYWDYTNMRFNYGKYICLEVSLLWGLLATAINYFVLPWVNNVVKKIPFWVSIIFIVLFILDIVFTLIN